MALPELFYGSLALGPLIVALVAFAKVFGLPNDKAPLAVLVLTALAFGLILATNVYPDIQAPVTAAFNVLITLLTVFGFYDAQKNVTRAMRGSAS